MAVPGSRDPPAAHMDAWDQPLPIVATWACNVHRNPQLFFSSSIDAFKQYFLAAFLCMWHMLIILVMSLYASLACGQRQLPRRHHVCGLGQAHLSRPAFAAGLLKS